MNEQLREIDFAVAELMGHTVKRIRKYATMDKPGHPNVMVMVPKYTEDIARAFEIVAFMKEHKDIPKRIFNLLVYPYNRAYAYFGSFDDDVEWSEGNGDHAIQLAICKAFLVANEWVDSFLL